jgi:hypothetical protein
LIKEGTTGWPSTRNTRNFTPSICRAAGRPRPDIVGNDEQGKGGESYKPNTYASRPPGAWHGPFKSEKGCLLFEIHYFDPA